MQVTANMRAVGMSVATMALSCSRTRGNVV
jgi:hypothetical protein